MTESRQPDKGFRLSDLPGLAMVIGWFVGEAQEAHHQKKERKKKVRPWKYRVRTDPVNWQRFDGTPEEWKLFQRALRRKHGKDYIL